MTEITVPDKPFTPLIAGHVGAPHREVRALPKDGRVARYIVTCVQNNTELHVPLWNNLRAFAREIGAEIMVSRFTYNKGAYGIKSIKPGTAKPSDTDATVAWPSECDEFLMDRGVELAPGLLWCGEMNILPTATQPLTGLESYSGRKSSIIPHVKFAMRSIPSGRNEGTKLMWTTGTVTQRNYIQKRAGLTAEFHHGYGALIVEVNAAGEWWVRQINADSEGNFFDLLYKVRDGAVRSTANQKHVVEAITYGDVHVAALDPIVAETTWGAGGMLETLRPKYQFFHDVLDFRTREVHITKRRLWHDLYRTWKQGHTSVEQECFDVGAFLLGTYRDWSQSIIVMSNHDLFLREWLHIGDYRADPENAVFFLKAQLHAYQVMEQNPNTDANMLYWALATTHGEKAASAFTYLDLDESFIICPDANGGIECGMHGHLGPNGSRGSPQTLAKMGRKAIIGHSHSAGIYDGVYVTGISGKLDQGYNVGPSSWSQTHVVTFPNGKRQVITLWNGKWRA